MRLNYEDALDATCRLLNTTRAKLLARSPNRAAVTARQELIRTMIRGGWQPIDIATILRCHHTTVLHALGRHNKPSNP